MKSALWLTGVWCLVFCSSFGQTPPRYNLKQCIDLALQNNLTVRQNQLPVENTAVALRQSKTDLLPNLNGSIGYGFNQGRNLDPITNVYINQELSSSGLNLGSSLMVFNGLRLHNLIQQNKYSHQGAKMDLKQAQDNLTLNVMLAYLQVLTNEDLVAISKAQLAVTQKQIERTGAQVNEGLGGKFQVSDLSGQKANEEMNLLNLENNLRQARLSLCQLINVELNTEIEIERITTPLPQSPYAITPYQVYESALENMAVFKANRFRVQSAEKSVHVARAGFMPSLSFSGNLGTSYSSLSSRLIPNGTVEEETGAYVRTNGVENPVLVTRNTFTSEKIGYVRQFQNNLGVFAGLSLQVPIFNSFQAINRVSLARISVRRSQLDLDVAKQQMRQNIEQAWLNMDAVYRRVALLTRQIADFEESFKAAEVRLQTGVINSAEFLIAKNNLDRARTNGILAQYEYAFRTRILDYYQGKLAW